MFVLLDLIWLPVIIFGFWMLALSTARSLGVPVGLASALYWWHTAFSLVYCMLTFVKISDATAYYYYGTHPNWVFDVGTQFINYITAILANIFGMGFLTCNIVVGFPGYLGLLLLAYLLIVHIPGPSDAVTDRRMQYLILFLPSLSYWTASLGKDGIAFMACCIALYACIDIGRRKGALILAVVILYLVRPHAALCMLVAFLAAFLFSSDLTLLFRVAMLAVTAVAFALLWPYVIGYVGLGDGFTTDDVSAYIERMQGFGYVGGTGDIVITGMPWPIRLFTYLFRPLVFDAKNLLQLLGSIENAVLLFLFVRKPRELAASFTMNNDLLLRFAAVYSVLMLVMLGNTTYNLGIAVRQKTMFLPALFVLLIHAYARSSSRANLSTASHATR